LTRILTITLRILTISAAAQSPWDGAEASFGAYADAYYSYYTNASDVRLQQHDCIGAFHNNLGLNIAQVTGSFDSDRFRGVTTVHFGDIPAITWESTYRNIQEANAGVRLAKGLWLDMGFFKTHVGTESFLPRDNMMSIISLGTFYGPFYQSGARLSYDFGKDWHIELHMINGYNKHIDDNDYKTFGMLISKQWNDRLFMSYSNMAGQENTGQLNDAYLLYQNIYAYMDFDRLTLQAGVDVAFANQWRYGGPGWLADPLVAGLLTAKYHIKNDLSVAVRGEVFHDQSSINSFRVIPNATPWNRRATTSSVYPAAGGGMTILGGTMSVEKAVEEFGFFRIESCFLYDPDPLVEDYPEGYRESVTRVHPMLGSRAQILATIGIYFDKTFTFAE